MKLSQPKAEIWVPDGTSVEKALERTTHMGISAHQDDIEIMALEGVLACFGKQDAWFTAVIVTDGAGSSRDGLYANYTNEQMQEVRRLEQKKAAFVGEFSCVIFLDYPSSAVKDSHNPHVKEDLKAILEASRPTVVYTHNLADKHDTHISVALRTIAALRELPSDHRPKKLYGCEVWRDLDWMDDNDKVVFRLDQHENIAASLVGVFDSQIVGGKRYDLATMGRRRAHATYHQSHAVDAAQMINFGMDLTPLVQSPTLDPAEYVAGFLRRFSESVNDKIRKYV
jgi:LmbE family N-acetylglucosaminyl deacetylase